MDQLGDLTLRQARASNHPGRASHGGALFYFPVFTRVHSRVMIFWVGRSFELTV